MDRRSQFQLLWSSKCGWTQKHANERKTERQWVQKAMGNKVPWKTGMLLCLPVTSRPLISLRKEAALSPCNFATAHLTACILIFISLELCKLKNRDPWNGGPFRNAAQKGAKESKRALPRENCKQTRLETTRFGNLGTPKLQPSIPVDEVAISVTELGPS